MNLNETYWTKRYLDGEAGWDIGYVSTPLKNYFDQLENKHIRILIPGAGNSYEAEYLVNNGFENVYVCDLSAEPLNNLKKRCPQIKTEHLIQGDFFELNSHFEHTDLSHPEPGRRVPKNSLEKRTEEYPQLSFDLIIEQTFFCALDPSLRKKYFEKMLTLLSPGGHLVGLLFDDVLNTDKPPFGGNKTEYLTFIGEGFNIKTLERCYNSIEPRQGRELFMNLVKI